MDKKVIISYFPNFLDRLCIKYLFNITHLNMQISEIEKQIKICKQDFKEKGIITENPVKNDKDDILRKRNLATKESLNRIKRYFSVTLKLKTIHNVKKNLNNNDWRIHTEHSDKVGSNKSCKKSERLSEIKISPQKSKFLKRYNSRPKKKKPSLKFIDNKNDIKTVNNSILPYISGDPNNVLEGGKEISYTNKFISSQMKSTIKIPPIIRIKDYEKMPFIKNCFTPKDIEKVKNYFSLQKKLTKLREEKDTLKTNEMDRIFKEFQRNNYEQRYNVDKTKVISALIGEDNINNEIFKQERREKLYFDQISKSQLYTNKNNKFKSFKDKQNNS